MNVSDSITGVVSIVARTGHGETGYLSVTVSLWSVSPNSRDGSPSSFSKLPSLYLSLRTNSVVLLRKQHQ